MNNIKLFIFSFFFLMECSSLFSQENSPQKVFSIQELEWLSGYWVSSHQDSVTEEIWLPPHGKIMLGLNRNTTNEKAFFEYLRIEETKQGIVYFATPKGSKTTPFLLVELSASKAMFENKRHDFPQRILYQLKTPEELTVRIENDQQFYEWVWKKTPFPQNSSLFRAHENNLAQSTFTQLEQKLQNAKTIGIRFSIQSQGIFNATLEGTLLFKEPQILLLKIQGEFGQEKINIQLSTTPEKMFYENNEEKREWVTPNALQEGICLGITRMGLLHNLARLIGKSPPDRTDGTLKDWVQVQNMQHSHKAESEEELSFEVFVAKQRAAEAKLWLHGSEKLPLKREQVVRFKEGEMRVTESYSLFLLNEEAESLQAKLQKE